MNTQSYLPRKVKDNYESDNRTVFIMSLADAEAMMRRVKRHVIQQFCDGGGVKA